MTLYSNQLMNLTHNVNILLLYLLFRNLFEKNTNKRIEEEKT